MSAKAPAVQAPRAGCGGVVPPPEHRWRPGQSGNPLGRPKGYVDPTQAYVLVSTLPYADALLVAEGKRPRGWHQVEPSLAYVRAARELLSTKGNPVEINARMDGPVKQLVEKTGTDTETRAILALLAQLPPMPAQRRGVEENDDDGAPRTDS